MVILAISPMVGIIISGLIYVYMGNVLRKIVNPVNHDNISLYKDFSPYTQNSALDNLHYGPDYIEKITLDNEKAFVSPINFNS